MERGTRAPAMTQGISTRTWPPSSDARAGLQVCFKIVVGTQSFALSGLVMENRHCFCFMQRWPAPSVMGFQASTTTMHKGAVGPMV